MTKKAGYILRDLVPLFVGVLALLALVFLVLVVVL